MSPVLLESELVLASELAPVSVLVTPSPDVPVVPVVAVSSVSPPVVGGTPYIASDEPNVVGSTDVMDGSFVPAVPLVLVASVALPVDELVPEPPIVSSPSSSEGHAVRDNPIKTADAVRRNAPRSTASRRPHPGHVGSPIRV